MFVFQLLFTTIINGDSETSHFYTVDLFIYFLTLDRIQQSLLKYDLYALI
jgi:hypothetical protein